MVMAISLPSDLVRPVRSALAVVLGVLLLAACSDEQASPAAPDAVQQTEPQQTEPAEQGQERQPQRAAVPAPAQPQDEDRAPAQDEDRAPAQAVSTVIHLVDGEPPVFEATTASEALKFFRNWQHRTRSLAVELWVELVVNGEPRRVAVDVRQEWRSGAYESSTAFDDAPAQRVLWTADGFWLANNRELEPKWSPATRARIGFGEVEVYNLLSAPYAFPLLDGYYGQLEPVEFERDGRGGVASIVLSSGSGTMEYQLVDLINRVARQLWDHPPSQITIESFEFSISFADDHPQRIRIASRFRADGVEFELSAQTRIVGHDWRPFVFSAPPEPEAAPAPDQSAAAPSVEEVRARYDAWREQLTDLELEVRSWEPASGESWVESYMRAQIEPLQVWTNGLWIEEHSKHRFETLLNEDGAFLRRWADYDEGWLPTSPILLGQGGLLAMTGFGDHSKPRRLVGFERPFLCVERGSGSLIAVEWEGIAAWELDCDVGSSLIGEVTGLDAEGFEILPGVSEGDVNREIDSLHLRMVIERASGAALLTEVRFAGSLDEEPVDYATSTRLLSWNEPLDIPDGGLPVFEATTASEALKFFRNWQHQTRTLALELWVELVVNGESRRLAVDVRQDQRSGAYESSTAFDDAPAQRVLWTADGFWTANNPELEPKWSPASRARIGFGEVEVYDPLNAPYAFPLLDTYYGQLQPVEFERDGRGGVASMVLPSGSGTMEYQLVHLINRVARQLWDHPPSQITIESFEFSISFADDHPQGIRIASRFRADGVEFELSAQTRIVGDDWRPFVFSASPEPEAAPAPDQSAAAPSVEEVRARYDAWRDRLTHLELEVRSWEPASGESWVESYMRAQIEPLQVWTNGLWIESRSEHRFETLLNEDGAFLRWEDDHGEDWPLTSPLLLGQGGLLAITGFGDHSKPRRLVGFERPFLCVERGSGSLIAVEWAGIAAWELNCDVDRSLLGEVTGLDAGEFEILPGVSEGDVNREIDSLHLRMVIERASGAALLTEVRFAWSAAAVADGAVDFATSTRLLSWNEPLDIPDAGLPVFEAGTTVEALEFFGDYLQQTRTLAVEIQVEAVVDGEPRRMEADVHHQRRGEPGYWSSREIDGAPDRRVLWWGDSLKVDDDPGGSSYSYADATPAQIGCSGCDVYDFMARSPAFLFAAAESWALEPFAEFEPSAGGGVVRVVLPPEALAGDRMVSRAALNLIFGAADWLWEHRLGIEIDAFELSIVFADDRPQEVRLSSSFRADGAEIELSAQLSIVGDDWNPFPFSRPDLF